MITFTVYENITIESVSEENYVLWVFEVDVGSGEKVGIKAARRNKNEGSSVIVLWWFCSLLFLESENDRAPSH